MSYDDDYVGELTYRRNCGASEGQWCTWASTLQGNNAQKAHWPVDTDYTRTGQQLSEKEVPASAGDEIVMHCSSSYSSLLKVYKLTHQRQVQR